MTLFLKFLCSTSLWKSLFIRHPWQECPLGTQKCVSAPQGWLQRSEPEHSRFLEMREFHVTTEMLWPGKWFWAQSFCSFCLTLHCSHYLEPWLCAYPKLFPLQEKSWAQIIEIRGGGARTSTRAVMKMKRKMPVYMGWGKNELEKPCCSGIQWEECRKMLCIYY